MSLSSCKFATKNVISSIAKSQANLALPDHKRFCNKMAFSSLTFDYGKVDQAKYRIKRIGQERDIRYFYFHSDMGIYSMIENNLDKKESLDRIVKREMEDGKLEDL